MTPDPDSSADALSAEVKNFLGARRTLHTSVQIARAHGVGANEIARRMAPVASRPTVLAYLQARDLAVVVSRLLQEACLDAVFRATGPTPDNPRPRPATLGMVIGAHEVDPVVAVFANLHPKLDLHSLSLEPAPGAVLPTAGDLGLSEPVDLLLADGGQVQIRTRGDQRAGAARVTGTDLALDLDGQGNASSWVSTGRLGPPAR